MARKQARRAPAEPVKPMTDVQRRAAALRRREANAARSINLGEPTLEAQQHNRYERAKVKDPDAPAPRLVKRNLTARNLERWYSAGKIDYRQFTAGDRYRSAFERTGFEQRVTGSYQPRAGGGNGHEPAMPGTLRQMDAWRAWRAARDDLGTLAPGFDKLVIDDRLAPDVTPAEDALGIYTTRTMIIGVRICLDRLVAFYRL